MNLTHGGGHERRVVRLTMATRGEQPSGGVVPHVQDSSGVIDHDGAARDVPGECRPGRDLGGSIERLQQRSQGGALTGVTVEVGRDEFTDVRSCWGHGGTFHGAEEEDPAPAGAGSVPKAGTVEGCRPRTGERHRITNGAQSRKVITPRADRSPTSVPRTAGEECGNRAQTGGEPRTGGLGAALQMGGTQLLSHAALQSAVGYGRPGLDQ